MNTRTKVLVAILVTTFLGYLYCEYKNSAWRVKYEYLLVLPEPFRPERKLPLILFLHGAGERGSKLEIVNRAGPFRRMKEWKIEAILLAPQCPEDQDTWRPEALARLLDQVERVYSIDKSRVYLTGLSMGGEGVWSLAGLQPERFAAIAPICGEGNPEDAAKLAKIPIWAFHGSEDLIVPAKNGLAMIEAVRAAGGNPKFTVYQGVGHDSWTQTYNDPEFYRWLLSQKRSNRE